MGDDFFSKLETFIVTTGALASLAGLGVVYFYLSGDLPSIWP